MPLCSMYSALECALSIFLPADESHCPERDLTPMHLRIWFLQSVCLRSCKIAFNNILDMPLTAQSEALCYADANIFKSFLFPTLSILHQPKLMYNVQVFTQKVTLEFPNHLAPQEHEKPDRAKDCANALCSDVMKPEGGIESIPLFSESLILVGNDFELLSKCSFNIPIGQLALCFATYLHEIKPLVTLLFAL